MQPLVQNLVLIYGKKSSYFLHLKNFLPSICLGLTNSSRAVLRDEAPWRSKKGAAELWEKPRPKPFPGADSKTQAADAEGTHPDPAGSVCEETERGCDTEHFPVFEGILGPCRAFSQCHCSVQGQQWWNLIQPISLGARRGLREGKGKREESSSRVQRG